MSDHSEKPKKRFWRRAGRFFDISRKIILNLIFWTLVIALAVALIPRRIRIKENSLLYVQPQGILVDAVTRPSYPQELSPFMETVAEASSIELGQAILAAAEDDRINGMVLDLSSLQYASLAVLQDLEKDLKAFREKGKKIYAWAPMYNQSAYYLASAADHIYLDEMGRVLLSGFGVYRSYFRKGMDKWNLDMAVFQAGDYKSFVEPYLYSRMSDGVRQDNLRWIGNLWEQVLRALAANRQIKQEDLRGWIEGYPALLQQKAETEASAAILGGLVDTVGTWEDFSSDMVRVTGYDTDQEGFRSIHWLDYLAYLDSRPSMNPRKTVAVVTARGDIHGGEGTQWTIGSESLIRRLEMAEKESSVRAVVLRLDTGGGSAFASEEIRRTLERIRERGIPVVVSMGGVAASGGYWIASESDELWSAPGTITGSIGVFSMIPETDRFLEEHLGIEGDGVGTTWMAGQGRPDQSLNPSSRAVLQSGVDSTYDRFLSIVAENRDISRESLTSLAGGRIWTGEEASANGLNDKTGSLREAVQGAAVLAHLEEFHTWYVPDSGQTFLDALSSYFTSVVQGWMPPELRGFQARELTAPWLNLHPGEIYALSPVTDRNFPQLYEKTIDPMDNLLIWH